MYRFSLIIPIVFLIVLFPQQASARLISTDPSIAQHAKYFSDKPLRRSIREAERLRGEEIRDVRTIFNNDLTLRAKERRKHRIYYWYDRENNGSVQNSTTDIGDGYDNPYGNRFINNRLRQGGPPTWRNLKFQHRGQLRQFQTQ